MVRFLHTSDLHLTSSSPEEKSYSLQVLREILSTAEKADCEFILLSGDIFDRYSTIEALKKEFVQILDSFPGKIFGIPGNHEELGCPDMIYPFHADFGKMIKPDKRELRIEHFVSRAGASIAIHLIPFFREFPYDRLEPRQVGDKGLRIALAHGTEPSLATYLGPSPEEHDAILDAGAFAMAGFDYLALGHIHARKTLQRDGLVYAYPGSPRVVSTSERGQRAVQIVTWSTGQVCTTEEVILPSSGQVHEISLAVGLEGFSQPELSNLHLSSQDVVILRLTGFTEKEKEVLEEAKKFLDRLPGRKKILESSLQSLPQLLSHPLVSDFYARWKKGKPENSTADWNLVLQVGIEAILGKSA